MRKRTGAIIIACAAVLALGATAAVAGPILYRDFLAEPAAESPTLSADDSAFKSESAEALDPEQLDGTWIVSEGSFAGYRVDEVLNGTPVTVTGRTTEVSGTLSFVDLTLESAQFEVDVESIATDNPQRDRYFRQQALNASTHPTASFTLTDPVTVTKIPAVSEVVEQTLSGDLTIAGITNRVTFTVQLRSDGNVAEIAGQIPIAFADFEIEAPDLAFVSVEPTGLVEFSLLAVRD